MKLLTRILISGLVTFFIVVGILFLLIVNFRPPELPETELSHEERQVYEYTISQLYYGEEEEVGLTFSPREVSYFCESILAGESRYGFELAGIHLESGNNSLRARGVLQGPVGFYYLLELYGKIYYNEGNWQVKINSASLGSLPVSWLIPDEFSPRWPEELAGNYRLIALNLDASGLAARLHR